jgi:hypothetical protein
LEEGIDVIYRCILPEWAEETRRDLVKVQEGEFNQTKVEMLNELGYNIYFLPNAPTIYDPSKSVSGDQIDRFTSVFVDMDMKDGVHASKEEFVSLVLSSPIPPSRVVDSGNGIHVYWNVEGLDAMSYLRLQRRLCRFFKTDGAVGQIYQLMRVPGTVNTKDPDDFKLCQVLYEAEGAYSAEELDRVLPKITDADEAYCLQHYNRTYHIDQPEVEITGKIPVKFARLLKKSREVQALWQVPTDDRSKADYHLGHILFASGFTKQEALEVLVHTEKAAGRAYTHRISYAQNIIDKIWIYELEPGKDSLTLSRTVRQILDRGQELRGVRFPCWKYLDDTYHGFRLGHVLGLVAGSGVGKTAVALNMFEGFVQSNPEYDHFFVPLEQPDREIAERWRTMCADCPKLNEKVHVISNYDDDGSYRNLSLEDIKQYIIDFQKVTGRKVGCVVIDHIGALKKRGARQGENQDLVDICHEMKAFAIATNTLLVMQSQAPREKAGIGDVELNKDAAYGTVFFESYCDFLITIWQPLKRCYNQDGCPTVTAFKFCKIRHKRKNMDGIQEDVCYQMYFDPDTERLRELTQDEQKSADYFQTQCRRIRDQVRKHKEADLVPYVSVKWSEGDGEGETDRGQDSEGA